MGKAAIRLPSGVEEIKDVDAIGRQDWLLCSSPKHEVWLTPQRR
jgi:hypothetical protein